MTEIKDHKTFWKRSTMEIITFTEGSLADIIQLARKDIISLITTIASQKEEIESLQKESIWHHKYASFLKSVIRSGEQWEGSFEEFLTRIQEGENHANKPNG